MGRSRATDKALVTTDTVESLPLLYAPEGSGSAERMRVASERMARERAYQSIPVTTARKQAFLDALSAGLTVDLAADVAGCSSRAFYIHRQNDADFRQQWSDALDASVGALERSAESVAFDAPLDSMARVNALKLLLSGRSARYSQRPPASAPVSAELSANGQTIRFVSGSPLPD